ncbi:MAG: transposase [Desulfatiglandales bacterium]
MRLKDYARNHKRRKEYVQERGLLFVGVDVSKSKHGTCIGTQAGVICRKSAFIYCREGFRLFESALRKKMFRHNCKRVLIAMEPSGIYWYALFERLKGCGYGVCLVNCKAVRNT